MLTFFFDQHGPLLIDFLQRGTTVNAQRHSQTLTTLHIKSKSPSKLTRRVILLHDNAILHTANTITTLLQKFKWKVLVHPPYSPDLSPRLPNFWSPKKGCEGQTIHLGRRRQEVHAEMVHNAAPGIFRDRHSQVPQQPGPILQTLRYSFLFLRVWLVSF